MSVAPLLSVLFTIGIGIALVGYPELSNGAESAPGSRKQETKKMRTVPPIFGEVFKDVSPWGGVADPEPCLPAELRVENPFDLLKKRGIFLNAPTKVITNGKYVLPVCGSYNFSQKFLNTIRDIDQELVIVAVNTKTHQSYSTNLVNKALDELRPELTGGLSEKWQGTDEQLERLTAGRSFALSLYHYIPELPRKPAKYLIYALLGEQKSNVVEVEVVDRE